MRQSEVREHLSKLTTELDMLGFDSIEYVVHPYQNVRFEWDVNRKEKRIRLDVADWLTEMDGTVASDIVLTGLLRSTGSIDTYEASTVEAMNSWFSYERQERHIYRTAGLQDEDVEHRFDLSAIYSDLVEEGILEACASLHIGWYRDYRGTCDADPWFRTVFVSSRLDVGDVSEQSMRILMAKLAGNASTGFYDEPDCRDSVLDGIMSGFSDEDIERAHWELDKYVIW